MIYLDNAATTYPKPPAVREAVLHALEHEGANPGRGGHRMSIHTAEAIWDARETVADFFDFSHPERVVFTQNCTAALNIVLKGLLKNGGRAVISGYEHNAVVRPLYAQDPAAPPYDVAVPVVGDTAQTVEAFRRQIRPDTKVIVCTHASNVFGFVLPIRELAALAHAHGLPLVVDGAQSAGVVPLSMERDAVDYLCIAGHKGLYGPMSVGALLCAGEAPPPLTEGGTGTLSRLREQPSDLPERLESGTANVAGICGLAAGVRWVREQGIDRIRGHEQKLIRMLWEALNETEGVQVFPLYEATTGTLSFCLRDQPSEQVAAQLDGGGFAVRAGLHCAPLAHETAGTLRDGTVRVSCSAFTTAGQIGQFVNFLKKIRTSTL